MEEWLAKQPKTVVGKHNGLAQHVDVICSIYDLPLDLFLGGIAHRESVSSATASTHHHHHAEKTRDATEHVFVRAEGPRGLTCRTCGLVFAAHSEQQQHFSSPFHCHNLKRAQKNKPTISLEEYEDTIANKRRDNNMAEDSSDDDDENEPSRAETNEESATSDEEEEESPVDNDNDQSFRYEYSDEVGSVCKVFQSNAVGPQFKVQLKTSLPWHLSLSIALFRADSSFAARDWSQNTAIWRELYTQLDYVRTHPIMCVFILRSGKFAAAVFDNSKPAKPLLIHKVIRRYTVRAKAGGGQSSHDNKGSKAKSMGAQLRRYGEKALKEDIQNILTLWQDYIQSSGLILIATTKKMRPVFFEKEEGSNASITLLKKDDARVVSVPFVVDRPTLESAEMIRQRVLQVTVSSQPLSSLVPQQETAVPVGKANKANNNQSTSENTHAEKKKESLVQEEQLVDCPVSKELIAACQSESDDAAKRAVQTILDKFVKDRVSEEVEEDDQDESLRESYFDGWKLSMVLNLPQSLEELNTPLHIAVTKNLPHTVSLLLMNGANPEQPDARGRTPYFLAASKETRDVFRKARGELGEERWNWTKAGVPEALTDEKISLQKQKEKEKKKRAQQRKKEQKAKAEQEEKDRIESLRLQEELNKLAKAEQDARQREIAGNCEMCSKSLFKKDFFDVLDKKCCSTECVAKLRRKLAADAAMARFSK